MAKDNSSDTFFSSDYTKVFGSIPANMPFDVQSLMDVQRKNFQAFTEAQQLAVENLQAVAQRQTEIFSQLVEDNSKMAKEMMAEGTPEDKVAKQADLVKKSYEKSIQEAQTIADMVSKSNQQASEIINKRVSASLNEIKSAIKKDKKPQAATTTTKAA